MARLNLTLDEETFFSLRRDARKERTRLATYVKKLLQDLLARRRKEAEERRWAEAYRAANADNVCLARQAEAGQLELMGAEDEDQ